jgi:hypothetical protein
MALTDSDGEVDSISNPKTRGTSVISTGQREVSVFPDGRGPDPRFGMEVGF